MSSLNTPQKYQNKSCLPPKPSTPKAVQRTFVNFENIITSSNAFVASPKNLTPLKNSFFENTIKAPLKSNNSSPSHRRSFDVLTTNYSEDTKKIHDIIIKIENDEICFE